MRIENNNNGERRRRVPLLSKLPPQEGKTKRGPAAEQEHIMKRNRGKEECTKSSTGRVWDERRKTVRAEQSLVPPERGRDGTGLKKRRQPPNQKTGCGKSQAGMEQGALDVQKGKLINRPGLLSGDKHTAKPEGRRGEGSRAKKTTGPVRYRRGVKRLFLASPDEGGRGEGKRSSILQLQGKRNEAALGNKVP